MAIRLPLGGRAMTWLSIGLSSLAIISAALAIYAIGRGWTEYADDLGRQCDRSWQ
mgnify:CR=1 FL=1